MMQVLVSSLKRSRRSKILQRVLNYSSSSIESTQSSKIDVNGVTIVNDATSAERALETIRKLEMEDSDRIHACDTEVTDIDLKVQSPCGNGKVICASVYAGPDVDFGNGPRLWIDNLDEAEGTLDLFKDYFENNRIRKVWHNYGFDRHVLYNHDINCLGFAGDTLHMGRLFDSARINKGGYSLEALTTQLLGTPKITMKDRFGKRRILKDGSEGKEILVPSVVEIQRNDSMWASWVDYSVMDAELTWRLHEYLSERLRETEWAQGRSMMDFYEIYLVPFGELLTDMERIGVRIDLPYLRNIEAQARVEMDESEKTFRDWAKTHCADCEYMNIGSDKQIQQLLFAPCKNAKRGNHEVLSEERAFKIENTSGYIEPGKDTPKKNREITIRGLGWKSNKATASGWPAVSADVLRDLAGSDVHASPPKFGRAMDMMRSNDYDAGLEACRAIDSLLEYNSIGTMLSTFILSLQAQADSKSRIHGSLNINTETGRLSSRRPNLQNQPALEKDRFKIRNAFTCEPGNKMIVADYGQLELRLLAHMTRCKSMIDAFSAGGDFHSRTAMGMYPHIASAVDSGDVLLEWDEKDGEIPPVPLLKDKYASERRQAKVLNFSIAYGKTAHGLSKDFGVSVREAQNIVEKWYSDRPEVKEWQRLTIERARTTGSTRTLMGRYRHLPEINSKNRARRSHMERAAINTPIQGGAADVVMKAMIKIHQDERLEKIGWKLLLQIHDEVIMEGPEEHAEEAMKCLLENMRYPFEKPLLVDLTVDASCADTWYEAK